LILNNIRNPLTADCHIQCHNCYKTILPQWASLQPYVIHSQHFIRSCHLAEIVHRSSAAPQWRNAQMPDVQGAKTVPEPGAKQRRASLLGSYTKHQRKYDAAIKSRLAELMCAFTAANPKAA
jgi:hypothetical protein